MTLNLGCWSHHQTASEENESIRNLVKFLGLSNITLLNGALTHSRFTTNAYSTQKVKLELQGSFYFSLASISGLYAPPGLNSISNEKITINHSQPRHLDLKQTGRNLEGVRILPNISNIAASANLRGFAPFCKENWPYFENR